MEKIILASSSPYRKQLLKRLNIKFECISPNIDEDYFKNQGFAPQQLTSTLARVKALKIQKDYPEACIIGGDQALSFDGKILGKAGTKEKAVEQLLTLSGKNHNLITSIHICTKNKNFAYTDITTLSMRNLKHSQLERYVDLDNPIDCAGSYKLESYGISLFDTIESKDQSAIIGIPLLALSKILQEIGYELP